MFSPEAVRNDHERRHSHQINAVVVMNIMSFVALALVPTAFWCGVAELVALGLQYSYGATERLTIAIGTFALSLWVWTLMRLTGDE